MFCDEVQVHFIAGSGGKGTIAFRREKFVPQGGPSGGNGGSGGSIILRADENVNTLAEFNAHKVFRAPPASNGGGSQKAGKDADDLIMSVPIGTVVLDEAKKRILCDLGSAGSTYVVARGGKGGFGNAHFKSSTRQAPTFAELGEPGQERTCTLELKLVADVGIIGIPSVGKSTMISRISNARPKIAAYPFTTITPNLGLVTMTPFGGSIKQSFVACDLPGLIEGAHEGKGLGIQFLKHVARNRVLIHLLDITAEDPNFEYKMIRKELKKFDKNLLQKPCIVAFNKIESLSEDEVKKKIAVFKRKQPKVRPLYLVSCLTGKGLKELMFAVWEQLSVARTTDAAAVKELASQNALKTEEEYTIFKPANEEDPKVYHIEVVSKKRGKRVFRVTGRRIEQIVVMSDLTNQEAVARIYDVIEKLSIQKELRRYGAKFGDDILIGKATIIFRWHDGGRVTIAP